MVGSFATLVHRALLVDHLRELLVQLEVDAAHDRLEVLDALAQEPVLFGDPLDLGVVHPAAALGLELELALLLLVPEPRDVHR